MIVLNKILYAIFLAGSIGILLGCIGLTIWIILVAFRNEIIPSYCDMAKYSTQDRYNEIILLKKIMVFAVKSIASTVICFITIRVTILILNMVISELAVLIR